MDNIVVNKKLIDEGEVDDKGHVHNDKVNFQFKGFM